MGAGGGVAGGRGAVVAGLPLLPFLKYLVLRDKLCAVHRWLVSNERISPGMIRSPSSDVNPSPPPLPCERNPVGAYSMHAVVWMVGLEANVDTDADDANDSPTPALPTETDKTKNIKTPTVTSTTTKNNDT